METNYTVDYFIKKFEAIPENMWTKGWDAKGKPTCATGHCGFDNGRRDKATKENISLIKLFEGTAIHMDGEVVDETDDRFSWKVVRVNDGFATEYQQPTPKQRILAALYDIRAIEYLKEADLHGCAFIKAFEPTRNKNNKKIYDGLFKCGCGEEFRTQLEKVKCGNTKSCGCLHKEFLKKTFVKHGMALTPLYQCWFNMIGRCTNDKHQSYKYYGGRGISVCNDWLISFDSFREWATSNGWAEGLTLDRYPNNDGNYEPSNCRWATMKQQANNTRRSKRKDITSELAVLPINETSDLIVKKEKCLS